MGASNMVSGGRVPRPKPSIRSCVRAIIDAVSGFSSVSCLETWRIRVPRIRDRLHRIEPRSPNSRPGVRPEGLSLALPMVSPEGQAPSRCVSRSKGSSTAPPMPVRKSGHHGRSAPCASTSSSRLRHNRHAVGSQLQRTLTCDDLVGLRRSHRAVLWMTCRPVGSLPSHRNSPSVASP